MTDPVNHPGAPQGAAEQTDEERRGNGADNQAGRAAGRQANADNRHQCVGPDVEDGDAEQQGAGRLDDGREADVVAAVGANGTGGIIHSTTPIVPIERPWRDFCPNASSTSDGGDV